MRFEESKIVAGAYVYAFHDGNGKKALAIWSPTSESKVIDNFVLKLRDNVKEAKLITLEHGEIEGVAIPLKLKENTVTLTVSECPIFLTYSIN